MMESSCSRMNDSPLQVHMTIDTVFFSMARRDYDGFRKKRCFINPMLSFKTFAPPVHITAR